MSTDGRGPRIPGTFAVFFFTFLYYQLITPCHPSKVKLVPLSYVIQTDYSNLFVMRLCNPNYTQSCGFRDVTRAARLKALCNAVWAPPVVLVQPQRPASYIS